MAQIKSTDWVEAYSEDTPVQVTFTDGSVQYLSIDAALNRLDDQWDRVTARNYLVNQGEPLVRFNGSRYVLLTMAPVAAT